MTRSDYDAAEAALDQAFAIAPAGGGPWMTRARLDYSLHRLPAVEAILDRLDSGAVVGGDLRAAIDDTRAELAFQRGDYDGASQRFEAAVAQRREPARLFRLAMDRQARGDFAPADALFAEAEAAHYSASASDRAWYHLQRGLQDLHRGRYAEALAHYRDGEAEVAGWWLLDEHIAEVLVLLGRADEAIELYRSAVVQTGSPELMGALAGVLAEREPAEAEALLAQASERYHRRLASHPEASYGHAFDHFLAIDPALALELAERNLELRPGVPAHIALAQAYLRHGRASDAWSLLSPTLESPWRSAEHYATVAITLRRLDDHENAARYAGLAEAINPDAMLLEDALSAL